MCENNVNAVADVVADSSCFEIKHKHLLKGIYPVRKRSAPESLDSAATVPSPHIHTSPTLCEPTTVQQLGLTSTKQHTSSVTHSEFFPTKLSDAMCDNEPTSTVTVPRVDSARTHLSALSVSSHPPMSECHVYEPCPKRRQHDTAGCSHDALRPL